MKKYIIGSVVLLPFLIIASLWYSNAVFGNKSEIAIVTKYKEGRNILGQFTAKMAELAQVKQMSVDDQVRIITAVFGEGGRSANKAAWQWVQENNPKADMTLHTKMADIIDSSRNKFSNHQTTLLGGFCQPYQERLGHPIHAILLSISGYPDKKTNTYGKTIEQMCTPIESTYSKNAFESGVDDGIKL